MLRRGELYHNLIFFLYTMWSRTGSNGLGAGGAGQVVPARSGTARSRTHPFPRHGQERLTCHKQIPRLLMEKTQYSTVTVARTIDETITCSAAARHCGRARSQGTVTWVDTAGNWSLQYFIIPDLQYTHGFTPKRHLKTPTDL